MGIVLPCPIGSPPALCFGVQEAWRAAVAERAKQEVAAREAAARAAAAAERDEELQAVIARLEGEYAAKEAALQVRHWCCAACEGPWYA